MVCEQCGTVSNEGAKFCGKCGSPKVDSPQSVAIVACSQPSLTRGKKHNGVEHPYRRGMLKNP